VLKVVIRGELSERKDRVYGRKNLSFPLFVSRRRHQSVALSGGEASGWSLGRGLTERNLGATLFLSSDTSPRRCFGQRMRGYGEKTRIELAIRELSEPKDGRLRRETIGFSVRVERPHLGAALRAKGWEVTERNLGFSLFVIWWRATPPPNEVRWWGG
jgi:hypothetical protein